MRLLIIISLIFVVILVVVFRMRGGKNPFPWFEFYSRGRKEGFSFSEIGFLRRIVIQNKLDKPVSIYWSTKQLDRCLRPAILKINADEETTPEYKLAMVNKLLDLRNKAEFNLPKYTKRIRDTNALLPRQKLRIQEKDYGIFVSWVIEVKGKHLVITQPSGQQGWQSLNWASKKVNVFFWRVDDAGYTFVTRVLEQKTHEEYPLLYIAHSTNLERTQKRRAVRIETNLRAMFSPIIYSSTEGAKKASLSKNVHHGKIIDLSETGCLMLAGNVMKKNDRLKIDFSLTEEKRVVALGIIVNISKTGDDRVSKYHVMFLKMDPNARNNILLFVYNIFGERVEEDEKTKKKLANVVPVAKE